MTKSRDTPNQAKPVTAKPEAAGNDPITVLSTARGSFGPYGYAAGLLIIGVPADVAKANKAWLKSDPAAVEAAMAAGTDAVLFKS
ncbi:hypothetical protein [Comamonas odontotermitis]|uniref:hypothetical protein n=1 Tax=Comamonas odontotermitis TaxID=379895 RepID=UPI001CC708E8|nr:hypothetical protein [Comamonas odontotermitis]UBB16137.1 hypothetical protein LAD35_15085 [Comamonas odontotermitis]